MLGATGLLGAWALWVHKACRGWGLGSVGPWGLSGLPWNLGAKPDLETLAIASHGRPWLAMGAMAGHRQP